VTLPAGGGHHLAIGCPAARGPLLEIRPIADGLHRFTRKVAATV